MRKLKFVFVLRKEKRKMNNTKMYNQIKKRKEVAGELEKKVSVETNNKKQI